MPFLKGEGADRRRSRNSPFRRAERDRGYRIIPADPVAQPGMHRQRETSMHGGLPSRSLKRWISMIRASLIPSASHTASWEIFNPPSTSRLSGEAKWKRTESARYSERKVFSRASRWGDRARATRSCRATAVLYSRPTAERMRRPFTVAY